MFAARFSCALPTFQTSMPKSVVDMLHAEGFSFKNVMLQGRGTNLGVTKRFIGVGAGVPACT